MTFQKDLKYQKDVIKFLGKYVDRLLFAARMLSRIHFQIINADDCIMERKLSEAS